MGSARVKTNSHLPIVLLHTAKQRRHAATINAGNMFCAFLKGFGWINILHYDAIDSVIMASRWYSKRNLGLGLYFALFFGESGEINGYFESLWRNDMGSSLYKWYRTHSSVPSFKVTVLRVPPGTTNGSQKWKTWKVRWRKYQLTVVSWKNVAKSTEIHNEDVPRFTI